MDTPKLIEYRYDLHVYIYYNGKQELLNTTNIIGLDIHHDYFKNNFPVTILKLLLDQEHKNELIKNVDDKKFNKITLEIRKKTYDRNEEKYGTPQRILFKDFKYVVSPRESEITSVTPKSDELEDDLHGIVVGLIDFDTYNKTKKIVNTVLFKTTLKSAVLDCIKDYKNLVIEPFKDQQIDQLMIPLVGTTMEYLNFISKYYNIYDSGYLLYHDFERTYFISRNNDGIITKDEAIKFINISLGENDLYKKEYGQYIKDKVYTLSLTKDKLDNLIFKSNSDKQFGKLLIVPSIGETKEFKLYKENKNTKTISINSPNSDIGEVIKYNILINNSSFYVTKSGLDTKEFSVNKKYNLLSKTDNKKLQCILSGKTENYFWSKDSFILNSKLEFKIKPE